MCLASKATTKQEVFSIALVHMAVHHACNAPLGEEEVRALMSKGFFEPPSHEDAYQGGGEGMGAAMAAGMQGYDDK